ncbi:MAG TPA: lipoprotein-releasing ABC transporter ATP-binding protein LolD [Marinospirillum sp.]|uniref:lipoprotein-releasing ABC transporter ATP-binding protein LolD n=1 Tax=Marinospirillum sp. TaxID=2183934 RepID=UPI002B48750E|nr:lipoprotein-releasing ABC transporter ATP-binding protein LolD [Marinospirillum sp.]HKM15802.1 lipoprotein-releasing ABC transporter ATP-binding protein LolD [Marinospirillum sp.]
MTLKTKQAVLRCSTLNKSYTEGPQEVQVLTAIDFEIFAGDRIAIIGSSGSGKTTLLNMLGGLDLPSSGTVELAGKDFSKLNQKQRGQLRNQHLGFVYQFHHLLPEFTALENAAMPLLIAGKSMKEAKAQALKLLEKVSMAERAEHKPAELSGGERQRVALARALVTNPSCVLLDEPTGNLDQQTAAQVQQLITELAENSGTAFVIVTHDIELAQQQNRVLRLDKGQLRAANEA